MNSYWLLAYTQMEAAFIGNLFSAYNPFTAQALINVL